MKELSRWICQGRKVPEPWAIHLTARKERRRIRADTEIYADWIRIPSRRFLITDMSIVQAGRWIDSVGRILEIYDHPLDDRDRKQLRQELKELKESFQD